ncbi:hypothetical protein D3C86_1378700 [compost metagenome]
MAEAQATESGIRVAWRRRLSPGYMDDRAGRFLSDVLVRTAEQMPTVRAAFRLEGCRREGMFPL